MGHPGAQGTLLKPYLRRGNGVAEFLERPHSVNGLRGFFRPSGASPLLT